MGSNMTDRVWRIASAVFLFGMGALALMAVIAFAWAIWPEAWRSEGAANWASALGTFAAAGIALWITLRDGGRRHDEEMIRAKLAAAAISAQLESASVGLKFAVAGIEEWMNGDRSQYFDLLSLSTRLHAYQSAGGPRLYDLAPMPNNCAHNIAASIDLVIRATLNMPYAFGTNAAPAGTTKDELMASCLADLRRALPMVDSALRECRRASGFID